MISHLHRILYNIPPGEDGGVGDWVGFAAHDRPKDLAYHCLMSMSQSFYGFFRKATPVAVEGRQRYGECLALVNSNLRDSKKQKTNDTLRSVVILGAYEVCLAVNPKEFQLTYLAYVLDGPNGMDSARQRSGDVTPAARLQGLCQQRVLRYLPREQVLHLFSLTGDFDLDVPSSRRVDRKAMAACFSRQKYWRHSIRSPYGFASFERTTAPPKGRVHNHLRGTGSPGQIAAMVGWLEVIAVLQNVRRRCTE